jgi:hypothetical protein
VIPPHRPSFGTTRQSHRSTEPTFQGAGTGYPGSVLRPSVLGRSLLPSPRHERLGPLHLSGSSLTRLQSSRFRIGPPRGWGRCCIRPAGVSPAAVSADCDSDSGGTPGGRQGRLSVTGTPHGAWRNWRQAAEEHRVDPAPGLRPLGLGYAQHERGRQAARGPRFSTAVHTYVAGGSRPRAVRVAKRRAEGW